MFIKKRRVHSGFDSYEGGPPILIEGFLCIMQIFQGTYRNISMS